jgi:hypothetical protein
MLLAGAMGGYKLTWNRYAAVLGVFVSGYLGSGSSCGTCPGGVWHDAVIEGVEQVDFA